MGSIVLLAFGACVFPTLLGSVAIMISRPEPRWLLLAFYAGGIVTSVTSGVVVLALINHGEQLDSPRSTPDAAASVIAGLAALVFAWMMVSAKGSRIIGGWGSKHQGSNENAKRNKRPSWAERRLSRASWRIALVVGAVINLPGPLYLVALGDIARGGYSTPQQVGLILLFNVIMFLLVEVPLIGYLLQPAATTKGVALVSRWLKANGMRVTGWLVGVLGAGLLVQGIAAFAS